MCIVSKNKDNGGKIGRKTLMIIKEAISQLADEIQLACVENFGQSRMGVQRCEGAHSLTRMSTNAPMILVPLVGAKRITVAEQSYHAGSGSYIILPPNTVFDIEHLPDASTDRFLGIALIFDTETLEQFRKLYGSEIERWNFEPRWVANGTDELFSAIRDWVARNHNFPAEDSLIRLRMCEFLLLLMQLGTAGNLLFQHQPRLRDRVKHLLALDPSRHWCLGEVTTHLAMSESTLRRGLRQEDISFRDLLEEVRLERGIELVMATQMPIGQIAYDCGYHSQSRFSERFRMRFSLSPTELRAAQRQPQANVVPIRPRLATS